MVLIHEEVAYNGGSWLGGAGPMGERRAGQHSSGECQDAYYGQESSHGMVLPPCFGLATWHWAANPGVAREDEIRDWRSLGSRTWCQCSIRGMRVSISQGLTFIKA